METLSDKFTRWLKICNNFHVPVLFQAVAVAYLKGHWKYSKKVEINWNLDLGGKNKITDVFRFSEIALETT